MHNLIKSSVDENRDHGQRCMTDGKDTYVKTVGRAFRASQSRCSQTRSSKRLRVSRSSPALSAASDPVEFLGVRITKSFWDSKQARMREFGGVVSELVYPESDEKDRDIWYKVSYDSDSDSGEDLSQN